MGEKELEPNLPLLKRNEMLVEEFCNEVGVDRRVLKVWMHNNKNPLRKREMGFGHNGNGNGDSQL